jgi:hypothetical protein
VVLTDRATQCLTSFSLDFERTSADTSAGPDMTVSSVTVNGVPARFGFVQPTYPGDPNGQNDPNPAAHEASESNPVGGPDHNPLPPACTPELPNTNATADSMNGTQCPANKLVITPPTRIRGGATFTVTVNYTGPPGVHNDGDGTTEGWFRASDGGFVTTEPVASEDLMQPRPRIRSPTACSTRQTPRTGQAPPTSRCASSSSSGSTRPTRPAAERTGPRSPVLASPVPVSTPLAGRARSQRPESDRQWYGKAKDSLDPAFSLPVEHEATMGGGGIGVAPELL